MHIQHRQDGGGHLSPRSNQKGHLFLFPGMKLSGQSDGFVDSHHQRLRRADRKCRALDSQETSPRVTHCVISVMFTRDESGWLDHQRAAGVPRETDDRCEVPSRVQWPVQFYDQKLVLTCVQTTFNISVWKKKKKFCVLDYLFYWSVMNLLLETTFKTKEYLM